MKITKRIVFAIIVCLALFARYSYTVNAENSSSTLIIYPEYDSRIPRCYDYGVTVYQGSNAQKLTVYNRNANGEQMSNRCFKPDFDRRFCEFAFAGEVRVDIEVYSDFTSYSILPSSKAYRNEYHDGIISVWLDKNDTYFMVRLDDRDDTILSVFADAPEDYKYSPEDSSVLYVDEKWCDPNGNELIYDVPENIKTIYIAPGCVLYSRLLIKTNDVTVCGHGMLVDPYSDYYDTQSIGLDNYRMVVRVEGSNITIKDIKMIDGQNWNIYLYGGINHLVKNVKILTARITTDAVAVGSGNVEIDNCVFYVSDNVFTYNGYKGYHHIKNCLIGTTCAAIFPQHRSSNDIDFTDIYVFRANEGIVNNWYNPGRIQSDIKHITFDNLDCVDIVNAPWIFNGRDMGDAEKYFTFKNCHFANVRGDSNISGWNTKNGQAIYVENSDKYMHCSGYKIEFYDCTLDGKPIANPDIFNSQLTEGDEITFDIKYTASAPKQRITKKAVNHVYDKKVYIGNNLLSLKYQPVLSGGTLYLPETAICNALGIKANPETTGTVIESVKYVTVDTVKKYYTEAAYDDSAKAIRITAISDIRNNIVKEKTYTSTWNPYAYPNVILGSYVDKDNEVVLRCDVNSNVNYPGMFTDITDGIKQNGAGKYTISFDAKSADGGSYAGQILLHNIYYVGYSEIDRQLTEKFVASGQWEHFEVQVDMSKWDTTDKALSFIRISSANTPGFDVLFKNIMMYRSDATEEPAEEAVEEIAKVDDSTGDKDDSSGSDNDSSSDLDKDDNQGSDKTDTDSGKDINKEDNTESKTNIDSQLTADETTNLTGVGTLSADGKILTDLDGTKYLVVEKMTMAAVKKNAKIADKKSAGKYKITKVTKKGGKVTGGTVTYIKPYNKNCTSANIKSSIKIAGATFKVTALNASAFKNCKKLTKVNIGSNISKIGKSAFQGCKKLKSVNIKTTKLKSSRVGANAFKGISATAKVKVPKKKLNAYKKILKKKGISGKKQKITK